MAVNAYSSVNSPAERADDGSTDEKILADARARFRLAEEAEHDIRNQALDDLRFRAGEHWPTELKQARDLDGRPCLTINRMPQFIQQVTNDQRQNRPSIKVHPVDDKADPKTAKRYQGLIRHIEYNSNADVAYATAFEGAVTHGFGYFRVVTDYVSPTGFEQEILIKRVRNAFSVLLDPFHQEPDGSDASWGFVFEDISKEDFRARYGEDAEGSSAAWELLGSEAAYWRTTQGYRVAEYFYKEFEERDICLLSTGEAVAKAECEERLRALAAQGVSATVVKERRARIPVIRWCKLTGVRVLEKTDWLGKYIPIVPVYGQELDINGKRVLEGIVRNAKDPSRMYDYWASAETEAIALAPRAPFIGYEGQFAGHEHKWESANRKNHAYLEVRPMAIGGQPAPLPQRNAFEPAVQAITQARMLASDDVKATTGIYDSSLGARSNETSGKAILARNNQTQTSNFHFIDNLTRSLRHAGRILLDLIPNVYDTPRWERIVGDEGEHEVVLFNAPFKDRGEEVTYNLGVGKYDVTVDVGPSYATKRQEAVASMLEVTRAYPQVAQIAGDLMVKNMDWPGAQEIAERLKKTLPPGLADDPNQKKQPIPPEVQAQMTQMNQMVEQLTGRLNELQAEREQKLLELESRERIEMKKLEVQVELKRAELDSKESLTLLSNEIAQLNERLSLLRMEQPIETDLSQDPGMSEPVGGMTADAGQALPMPTGGPTPGQSIPFEDEGTPIA